MEMELISVKNPKELNFILGHSHFIKTVEDIHEALVQSVPGIEFGLAFCEASGSRLVRITGTHEETIRLAMENAQNIAAGHSFILFLKNAFPINVLPAVKSLPVVCRIFCATANPVQVIIAKTELGRGILGVVDGYVPGGTETEKDILKRKEFLRNIGYKLA